MKFLKGLGIFFAVCLAFSLWYVILGVVIIVLILGIILTIRKNRYFASPEFQMHRQRTATLASEYNEIASYVHDIYTRGIYELGTSTNGMYGHLATVEAQQPKTWQTLLRKKTDERPPHVYNSSEQVVLEAERDPIGSLTKYFHIEADLQTLKDVQRLSDDIARLETAVDNVHRREEDMLAHINPPPFIIKQYADEFWKKLNVYHVGLSVPYPVYRFEYTSADGKENRAVTVTLDTPTLDALSETLERKIRWAWPEGGERTLMTAQLRQRIKERDNYTCQNPGCGNSIMRERILVLEVVHKVPLSNGGNNEPENLQTLCWRCNRAKGSKMITQ